MSAELGCHGYEGWHDVIKDEQKHQYLSIWVDYNSDTANLEITLMRDAKSRRYFEIELDESGQRKLYEYLKKYIEG